MEDKFVTAWAEARAEAEKLGVRTRPVKDAMTQARRSLSGHRVSDGFDQLAAKGRLDLSLEALAVNKQFTVLFSDDEANNALERLINAGYF